MKCKNAAAPVRTLAWLCAAFSFALLLSLLLPLPGYLLAGGIAIALLGISLRRKSHLWRRLRLIGAGLLTGLLWAVLWRLCCYLPVSSQAGAEILLTGYAAEEPQETAYGYSVTLLRKGGGRVLLYLDEDMDIAVGDQVSGSVTLKESSRYLQTQGIWLTASAGQDITVETPESYPLRLLPALARMRLQLALDSLFPEAQSTFLKALVTGDTGHLSDTADNFLTRAGLRHIVAVSGLHVTFLAGLVMALPGGRRRVIFLCPLLIFFALMTGGSPSVWRAVVMESMVLAAPLFGRESDTPTSLTLALAILLARNPMSAFSVSLQLSFSAAAGILLFSCLLRQRLLDLGPERIRRLLLPVTSSLSVTLGAIVFTLPLSVLYFEEFSLIAPLSNLVVGPLISLVFGAALIIAGLWQLLPGLAALLAFPLSLLTRLTLALTEFFGRLSYSSLSTASFPVKCWLVFLAALLILTLLSTRLRQHPLPSLCLAVLSLCFLLILRSAAGQPAAGQLVTTVLDVGQGQSISFSCNGYTAAVDCGGDDDPGNALADWVEELGYSRLNVLAITHYDSDHTNGLDVLFSRVSVDTLLLPDSGTPAGDAIATLAEEHGTEVIWVSQTTTVSLGAATMTVFPPLTLSGDEEDSNEMGLAILCTIGEYEVLVTGDMSAETEEILADTYALPDIELLIVGHHGSRYSTGEALLDAVTPEIAVISVGADNPYGHPTETVLERLSERGIAVYRTDLQGRVTVRSGTAEDD